METTHAAKNYLYRRVTPVGLYNEAAVLPVARLKLGIFLVFKAKKSRWGSGWKNKMERISCPIKPGIFRGNRQITPINKRSVEYIQRLEYHAVPLLVLYALFSRWFIGGNSVRSLCLCA
ncbi:hypothetical protein B6I44_10170 [Klebsiella quasipneumoniae]|nr:hypothetical protein [Klebsiella quasipneumoniae]PLC94112.1 hypothetical protein B6I44_10170 [Klebsiella quasipneumoniae]